jgi:transcriptional regulator with XRE-family HTH domain
MNAVIKKSTGYNYKKAFEKAKTHEAYHEEGLRLDVAYRIIEAMASRKMSRVQLAKRLDVSAPYVTKLLQGHANLSLESLSKIASALDLKWQCVLLPRNAEIGLMSISHEEHGTSVRTVETATVEGCGQKPIGDDYVEKDKGVSYAVQIPA